MHHRFKSLGMSLMVPGIVLGYFNIVKGFQFNFLDSPVFAVSTCFSGVKFFVTSRSNLTNEIAILLLLTGLFFLIFSKEKDENETIRSLRYSSAFFALGIQFALFTFYTLFTFGLSYLVALCTPVVSLPVSHLIIFHLRLRKYRSGLRPGNRI